MITVGTRTLILNGQAHMVVFGRFSLDHTE
jgi:hypothetical protein